MINVCDCYDDTIIDIRIIMCVLYDPDTSGLVFIVVYPVIIVYCMCFKERSKMGLSCPHFILFPKKGGVRPHCFLVSSLAGMCMTLVRKQVRISLLFVFFAVRGVFIRRFSRRSCL